MKLSIHEKLRRLQAIAVRTKRPLDRRIYADLGLTRTKSKLHEGRVG